MSYFTHDHALDIEPDKRSLAVSYANLASKLGSKFPIDPVTLCELVLDDEPNVLWWQVAEYIDDVELTDYKPETNLWPNHSDSIIKFHRLDQASGGIIDHYCLVADHHIRSIIDSLDGKIKAASEYGEVFGYASYALIKQDETEAIQAEIVELDDPNSYTVQAGENLWDIGRKLNIKVDELIVQNDIDDPRRIHVGDILFLPVRTAKERNVITYEILPKPVAMHVSKQEGASKYSFGRANKWSDIHETGRQYPENHNVMVGAIANVELSEHGVTAAYYMDVIDLGNYEKNGRVQFTQGFNHTHLSEGHVVPRSPGHRTRIETPVAPPVVVAPVEVVEAEIITTPEPIIYALEEGPAQYYCSETVLVHELDGKRPDAPLKKGTSISYSHACEIGTDIYLLPASLYSRGFRYLVPQNALKEEEALFDTSMTIDEKIAIRTPLSASERKTVYLARSLSWFKSKQKNKGVQK